MILGTYIKGNNTGASADHLDCNAFAVALAAASLVVSGGIVIRNYAQRNLDLVARTVSYTVEPAVVLN